MAFLLLLLPLTFCLHRQSKVIQKYETDNAMLLVPNCPWPPGAHKVCSDSLICPTEALPHLAPGTCPTFLYFVLDYLPYPLCSVTLTFLLLLVYVKFVSTIGPLPGPFSLPGRPSPSQSMLLLTTEASVHISFEKPLTTHPKIALWCLYRVSL